MLIKRVGCVILNYNCSENVINLVKKIQAYDSIEDIVVVDNCSSLQERTIIEKIESICCDKVHLILLEENGGYAKGNNAGLRWLVNEKQDDIVIICNPDVRFREDVVKSIKNGFEQNDSYALLGAVRTDGNMKFTQRQYWNQPTFKSIVMESTFIGSWLLRKSEVYRLENSGIFEVPVVPGCFFAIRSDVLKEINYMDERTFLWYEENILSKKISDAGYKEGLITDCTIVHDHDLATTTKNFSIHSIAISQNSKGVYVNHYLNCSALERSIIKLIFKYQLFVYSASRIVKGRKK